MKTILTLDKTGRVVIPKEVRDHFGIGAGDTMELKTDAHGLRLELVSEPSRLRRKGKLWVYSGAAKVTAEQFEKYRADTYRKRDEQNWNPRG